MNTRTTVVVVGDSSQERWLAGLRDAMPHLDFQFEALQEEVSMETQQMDAAARASDAERLQREITELNQGVKKTGPVHLYLLDSGGLAGGDLTSQATLRAMARASLSNQTNVVAALMPNQDPDALNGKVSDSVLHVVRRFLNDGDVPTAESLQDVIKLLP